MIADSITPEGALSATDALVRFKSREELTHGDLAMLLRNEIALIVIPRFAHGEWLEVAADQVRVEIPGSFNGGPQFKRIGHAFIEVDDEVRRAEYHAQARHNSVRVRQLFSPFPSPVDELRALIEETWQGGANLLRVDGKPFAAGICRVQEPGIDLEPHTDRLERNLAPGSAFELQAQLSCNVYVHVPRSGGELEIWNNAPDEAEYERLRAGRRFSIDRDRLPPPDLVIKPAAGDLFILNPRVIHAVRPVEGEPRVTLGLFLGQVSETGPLVYWS